MTFTQLSVYQYGQGFIVACSPYSAHRVNFSLPFLNLGHLQAPKIGVSHDPLHSAFSVSTAGLSNTEQGEKSRTKAE